MSVNGEKSEWSDVISGVPQGSVIGPIMFLIYINDLPDGIKSHMGLFADDTKLYAEIENKEQAEIMQDDLERLNTWSNKWQLEFNIRKCKVLHIGKKNKEFSYFMSKDGSKQKLEEVTHEKDLGITFESNGSFDKHIDNIVLNANRNLGIIKRTFQQIDQEMLVVLYKSLVRPILEYGSQVWSPLKKG